MKIKLNYKESPYIKIAHGKHKDLICGNKCEIFIVCVYVCTVQRPTNFKHIFVVYTKIFIIQSSFYGYFCSDLIAFIFLTVC